MASKSGFRFTKLRSFLLLLLILAAAWIIQQNMPGGETIIVNGKQVTVIDGDSFRDADSEYRIYGIDAPEYRQTCLDASGSNWPCGKRARAALEEMLRAGSHSCTVQTRDRFGRLVVACSDDDEDLGAQMVEQGLALSSDHFDQVVFGREEDRAKKAKRGIWQGKFDKPADWRASHPRGDSAPSPSR